MSLSYIKPALTTEQLIESLIKNGLAISNKDSAIFHLKTVSYHRLSSYFEPFLHDGQQFKLNSTFEAVWELYTFDRKLRLLLNDPLETIEVAFRTTISDNMSMLYGSHWYLDPQHFKDQKRFQTFIKQIDELCRTSHEPSIKGYYKKYSIPGYPPSWVIVECIPFGTCNSLFRNLKKLNDKKMISKIFGYHPTAMESWMDSLRYTRNLCAHHARFWNRWFVISPKLTYLYGPSFNKENSFYAQAIIISNLLKSINGGIEWREKLFSLLDSYSQLNVAHMGFQENWEEDSFWKTK